MKILSGALFAFSLPLTFALSGRAQDSPPPPAAPIFGENTSAAPSPSPVWSDARLQISLTPPAGWTEAAQHPGLAVAFHGPVDNGFSATMALGNRALRTDATPQELADLLTREQEKTLPNYRVTGQTRSRLGDTDVVRVDAQYRAPDLNLPLQMRTIYTKHGDQFYEFVFTSTARTFAANAALFEQSLQTIRWSVPIPSETLHITNLGIAVTIPEGWRRVLPGEPGYTPRYIGINGPIVDGFRSNFIFESRTLPAIDLASAAQQEYTRLHQADPTYRLLNRTNVALDGVPAIVQDAASKLPDGREIRQRAVIVLQGNRMFNFALTTGARGFDAATQAVFAKFMLSLQWERPTTAPPPAQ